MRNSTTNNKESSEVLFQQLGNVWYVFSEIDDEVVYSALPSGMDPRTTDLELYSIIEEHMEKVALHHKRGDSQTAA